MTRRPDAIRVSSHPDNAREPFRHYADGGWWLEIECWNCTEATYIAGPELVRRFGAEASSGSIYPRLRCTRCRAALPSIRAVRFEG